MIKQNQGDSLKAMKAMPDKAYDLAIVDPPYGIGTGKMGYLNQSHAAPQKNGSRLQVKKQIYDSYDWDNSAPGQEYFDELCRVSKHQIIFGINYFDWQGVGSGRIKWDKMFAEKSSFKRHEYAYCSLIDYEYEIKLMWAGMFQAKSLEEPTVQQGNKKLNEKRIHPTQKPVLLYKRMLLDFAQAGWKILDTHRGSDSLAIACYDLGFDFEGWEIKENYHVSGAARLQSHINLGAQIQL